MGINIGPILSPQQSLRGKLLDLLLQYERMGNSAESCVTIIKEALIKIL